MTANPSAGECENQSSGAQARKRAGIEGSSCTCFVHSWVMLGEVESACTWNRETDPTLLAIANRFFCFGWKCKSNTAYGTSILWIWDLRGVGIGSLRAG